jgi:hypothetical protein
MCDNSGSGEHILEQSESRYALSFLADPSQSFDDLKLHSNLSIALAELVTLSTLTCSDTRNQGFSEATHQNCAADETQRYGNGE